MARDNAASALRRVAIVLSQLRPGGMERVVVHLAATLPEYGVEPLVVCLERPGQLAGDLADAGVRVVALNSLRGFDVKAIVRLARLLRQFDPSVVNVHDYSSLPYAVLASLTSRRRPIVFTAHGLLYHGFEKPRLRYTLSARRLAAITAVSPQVAARHGEHLSWTRRIDIVPNGVPRIARSAELGRQVRAELGISPDSTVFLAVGNPRPEKGFEDLLEAAAALRQTAANFTVLVAGCLSHSDYCRALLDMQKRLALEETVRFLGFRDDTEALYSAADAFVLSSRSEGMPMVILEAMMASLPVIATRVGGVGDVVSAGGGLLVDAAAPGQLSGAMGCLLNDANLRDALGRRAREYAAANHSVEQMVRLYLRTFERVAAGAAGGCRGRRT